MPPLVIPTRADSTLGDHRRFPGCRMQIVCCMCGWSKSYRPERIVDRLRQLKAGGQATTLQQVAQRVGWDCPACHRVRWRAELAFPATLTEREARRLTNLSRH